MKKEKNSGYSPCLKLIFIILVLAGFFYGTSSLQENKDDYVIIYDKNND